MAKFTGFDGTDEEWGEEYDGHGHVLAWDNNWAISTDGRWSENHAECQHDDGQLGGLEANGRASVGARRALDRSEPGGPRCEPGVP